VMMESHWMQQLNYLPSALMTAVRKSWKTAARNFWMKVVTVFHWMQQLNYLPPALMAETKKFWMKAARKFWMKVAMVFHWMQRLNYLPPATWMTVTRKQLNYLPPIPLGEIQIICQQQQENHLQIFQ